MKNTPQQNALAERMNRPLMDKVICMLISSMLQKILQAEALNTACYLVNRSPSKAMSYKTLVDLWSGKHANYCKLRIFGCLAYAHAKKGMLESRALNYRFLDYPDGVKHYGLWCVEFKYLIT